MGTTTTPRPSILDSIAACFASARTSTWTSAQLTMLDRLIDDVCDELDQIMDRFDHERFKKQAHYKWGVVID